MLQTKQARTGSHRRPVSIAVVYTYNNVITLFARRLLSGWIIMMYTQYLILYIYRLFILVVCLFGSLFIQPAKLASTLYTLLHRIIIKFIGRIIYQAFFLLSPIDRYYVSKEFFLDKIKKKNIREFEGGDIIEERAARRCLLKKNKLYLTMTIRIEMRTNKTVNGILLLPSTDALCPAAYSFCIKE